MPPRFHPSVRLFIASLGSACSIALVSLTILAGIMMSSSLQNRVWRTELQGYLENDTNKLISTVLVYPFILLVLIGCRRALDQRSFVSLGLRPRRVFRDFGMGGLCGALAITFLFGVLLVSGQVQIEGPSPEAFEAGALTSAGVLALFAALFLCVGFMEEIWFRGYALHNLNAWFGWKGAVAVQAVAFGVIHPLNEMQQGKTATETFWDARVALLNIILIGVFFAQCYRKTGSLWFPIGFHFTWNFFLGCVWSLPVSGIQTFRLLDVVSSDSSALSGGSFGAEGSLFLTFLTAALIFVMARMPDHPQADLDLALLTHGGAPGPVARETPAEPVDESEPAPDDHERRGPSRFRTSMRPLSSEPQLPPEFFQSPPPSPAPDAPAAEHDAALRTDVSDNAFLPRPQDPSESQVEAASQAPAQFTPPPPPEEPLTVTPPTTGEPAAAEGDKPAHARTAPRW